MCDAKGSRVRDHTRSKHSVLPAAAYLKVSMHNTVALQVYQSLAQLNEYQQHLALRRELGRWLASHKVVNDALEVAL